MTLDALGNWRESWTGLDGSGTYSDTTERDDRTHDLFNRIDARTLKGQGASGADLTMGPLGYDLASNLSSWKVQAGTSATAVAAVHDAWNRLVDVTYAGDLRTRQEYNALHWRTFRVADTSGTGADPEQARLMYYGHDGRRWWSGCPSSLPCGSCWRCSRAACRWSRSSPSPLRSESR